MHFAYNGISIDSKKMSLFITNLIDCAEYVWENNKMFCDKWKVKKVVDLNKSIN
jgi:hypothetical protein